MTSPQYLKANPLRVLPAELLLIIINDFIPDLNAWFPRKLVDRNARWRESQYYKQIRFLASLRLIDSSWDRFVTPILFSTFVSRPQPSLLKEKDIFRNHGPLIRHLVVRGNIGQSVKYHDHELLGACLAQCTNIQRLDLVSISWMLLGCRKGDIRRIFQVLEGCPTLKSIIVRTSESVDTTLIYALSQSLVGIGRIAKKLTMLDISGWVDRSSYSTTIKFNLPSSLPNLTWLKLRNIGPMEDATVKKLISRIVRREIGHDGKARRVVPLQKLEIHEPDGQFVDRLLLRWILASNNLGRGLTTLMFYCDSLKPCNGDEQESLPLFIASTCPNLVRLHYTAPCPINVLRVLPPKLQEFAFIIAAPPFYHRPLPPSIITSHEPIVNFLHSTERPLTGLTLLISWAEINEHRDNSLRETCMQVGVRYRRFFFDV